MSRQNIPLGRILGIRIGLDYSWFLVFALLTWLLAQDYYPVEFKNWPSLLYWFMGVLTAIMLFVSVLLHELGHSLVALRYKMPVRSITLFIFGGVAQIGAEPPSAIAEFLIANRRSSRELDAGSLFLCGAAAGKRHSTPLGSGQVSSLHQPCAGCVQLDPWVSAGWRPRFSGHRVGAYQKHAARYANRGLCGAIFRPFVHLPGRLEGVRRQRRRWTVDRFDRLLS
jgi:hypothetical protein